MHTHTAATKSELSLSFSSSFSAERLSVILIRNGQSRIKLSVGGVVIQKGRDGTWRELQMMWSQ